MAHLFHLRTLLPVMLAVGLAFQGCGALQTSATESGTAIDQADVKSTPKSTTRVTRKRSQVTRAEKARRPRKPSPPKLPDVIEAEE